MNDGIKVNFKNKSDEEICTQLKELMKSLQRTINYYQFVNLNTERQARSDLTYSKELFNEKNCKRYYPFEDNFSCTTALQKMYNHDEKLINCLTGEFPCANHKITKSEIDKHVRGYEQNYSKFMNDACFDKYKKGI